MTARRPLTPYPATEEFTRPLLATGVGLVPRRAEVEPDVDVGHLGLLQEGFVCQASNDHGVLTVAWRMHREANFMARPRVPEEKRQRTAQACESCKRRKQKCNGVNPCSTCTKRNFTCLYRPEFGDPASMIATDGNVNSRQRRRSSQHIASPKATRSRSVSTEGKLFAHGLSRAFAGQEMSWQEQGLPSRSRVHSENGRTRPHEHGLSEERSPAETCQSVGSRWVWSSEPDEITVQPQMRILQDAAKRLCYIGDPGTLACLQLVRWAVSLQGYAESQFVQDRERIHFVEDSVIIPDEAQLPWHMPTREVAQLLVKSFFVNTRGLVDVIDKNAFERDVDAFYRSPDGSKTTFRCTLYLVLATGMVLATPTPGSPDEDLLRESDTMGKYSAELMFQSAKVLCDFSDPVSNSDGNQFWAIQTQTLATIYMLAVCRRNASYAYLGLAVRSAYAIGLHREDVVDTINKLDRKLLQDKVNIWKTLYILDRFLSSSLGRPFAIQDEDCSVKHVQTPEISRLDETGQEASMHCCRLLGIALKKVYNRTVLPTNIASEELLKLDRDWVERLHPDLYWRLSELPADPERGISLLHVQLMHHHMVLMATRPFYFYAILQNKEEKFTMPLGSPLETFVRSCVLAAYDTILLIRYAKDAGYLSRRDPFVNHFLFLASVIVLTNEMFPLYEHESSAQTIETAIDITTYCRETDPQADRWHYILTTYREVVFLEKAARVERCRRRPSQPLTTPSPASLARLSVVGSSRDADVAVVPLRLRHGMPIPLFSEVQSSPSTAGVDVDMDMDEKVAYAAGRTKGRLGSWDDHRSI